MNSRVGVEPPQCRMDGICLQKKKHSWRTILFPSSLCLPFSLRPIQLLTEETLALLPRRPNQRFDFYGTIRSVYACIRSSAKLRSFSSTLRSWVCFSGEGRGDRNLSRPRRRWCHERKIGVFSTHRVHWCFLCDSSFSILPQLLKIRCFGYLWFIPLWSAFIIERQLYVISRPTIITSKFTLLRRHFLNCANCLR